MLYRNFLAMETEELLRSYPADGCVLMMAEACGRCIVEMVWDDLKPSDILTPASFDNAIAALMALGGSTNAIVHLVAMAGRAGIRLDLDRFDAISRKVPLLANLRPSGSKYLMEDFFYAGGLRALLAELKPVLSWNERTVNGHTLGENIGDAKSYSRDVIAAFDQPVQSVGGLACCTSHPSRSSAARSHWCATAI